MLIYRQFNAALNIIIGDILAPLREKHIKHFKYQRQNNGKTIIIK